ncbi:UDP-3-O-glucosamine N-acyltransferase [Stereum hirsutum FP-91666 SS1]|uniref:UDP-3-O-glucosamine N-acyltransferase n=1 Tax=Stereum hirsutum (strain FP-91666) TaxID=721885 RepID=UPI0004449981|nr:UDP-3-O-glucosamine N-acyltransferase [Stereum hirsutum FP-91666 SS1]EIM83137.1 UDP-3-O-glucosamine N-acyltransferase [Stereum hirsutum FP-91666 SS1]
MDFSDDGSTLISREFLAVVLAGVGNELLPLSSEQGEESCPKALLPIANKPMIDYPLTWLEQSGITDVLLLCPASHRGAISHHIHSGTSAPTSYPSLRIDVLSFDDSADLTGGTCSVLRNFSSRIQRDFVLLPCDFVPPETLPLTDILNKFRVESNLDGSIVTSCWFKFHRPDKGTIPEEWGAPQPSTPIVWDRHSGTLLHVDTPDDADRNNDELELRMGLLSKFPRTNLSSTYQDSHVYVCKRAVLDVLQIKDEFDSFREEFIPWLCKLQYQRTKQERYGRIFKSLSTSGSQVMAMRHSTLQSSSTRANYGHLLGLSLEADSPSQKIATLSAPPSPSETDQDDSSSPTSFRMGVVIHENPTGQCGRANNLPTLLELNRKFLAKATYTLPTDPENRALVDPKSQISQDSIIGDSTRVGERTSVKRTVVGKHCVIGKMVKIVGCILLDHCVVEDGAKLDGCILGRGTKVGAKAELKQCVTQAGYEVDAGGSFKNEKLEVSDWAAASDRSSSAETSEDESESE